MTFPQLPASLTNWMTKTDRRLFDVERRRYKVVEVINDLDDVDGVPDDNDVITWDEAAKMWKPGPGGGGGGAWLSASWDCDGSTSAPLVEMGSAGSVALASATPSPSQVTGAIELNQAGVWVVSISARGESGGDSDPWTISVGINPAGLGADRWVCGDTSGDKAESGDTSYWYTGASAPVVAEVGDVLEVFAGPWYNEFATTNGHRGTVSAVYLGPATT